MAEIRDNRREPIPSRPHPPAGHPAQEPADFPVLRFLCATGACVGVILLGLAWADWEVVAAPGGARALPEDVLLEEPERIGRVYQSLIPASSSRQLFQQARDRLDSYGWVDHTHGLVRIPIQRAIDLHLAAMEASS